MAVYVDDAVHRWRGLRWAHLMADTVGELHAMARHLGIPQRAFQDKASGVHYDIPAHLRPLAIALGTVPLSRHTDKTRLRAVIANARTQYSGSAESDA